MKSMTRELPELELVAVIIAVIIGLTAPGSASAE
jgi:hypothetical protein